MKKLSIAGFIVLLFVIAGCQKEKSEDNNAKKLAEYKAKLQGTWKLQKTEEEYWHPVNTLINTDIIQGEAGDSAVFTDKLVKGYQDINGQPEEDVYDYHWVNDSTITFDDERYVIRNLTDTELYLHSEEIRTSDNTKDVYKVFLVR
jgi:hypothetical protein